MLQPETVVDSLPLRLSSFVHVLPVTKEYVALYHSLRIKTFFLEQRFNHLLDSLRSGITLDALRRKFEESEWKQIGKLLVRLQEFEIVVPINHDESHDLQMLRDAFTCQPEITGMYVMLTDKCNLSCGYCFVEKPLTAEHTFSMMNSETAAWSIDRFVAWSESEFIRTVIFCGGEPLLNLSALRSGLDRIGYHINAGRLDDQIRLQLITNGTLVTQEVVEIAKKNRLKVSVSIDGMQQFHDFERKTACGNGTHAKAVKGYRMLVEAGIPVGVSMTISRGHVGHLIENVKWLIDNLGIRSIGFNILMDIDPKAPVPMDYANAVNDEMIQCFKILREKGIYEDRIMRKVESFSEGTPYLHDCSGCGHQIVVSPDGRVGVCHGYSGWEKYFVQPNDQFDPRQHSFWKEWLKRSPINIPQCRNCEALGICGGGCACSADVRNGSIWAINETFCSHSRKVLHWMIHDLFEKAMEEGGN